MTMERAKGRGWANRSPMTAQGLRRGQGYPGESCFRWNIDSLRPTGANVCWAEASIQRDERGAILGYIGTITDLTERIEAEESLQA
jgi:PAS domain-containing protein